LLPNELRQSVSFHKLEEPKLSDLLGLEVSPFLVSLQPFSQLNYIDTAVRRLGCRSLTLEDHYIDRHHMDDHSVFYSRSLFPYPNYCRRINFFSCDKEKLIASLSRLRRSAREHNEDTLSSGSAEFSAKYYLGFCVIKPLPGCPVGRSVIRPPLPEGPLALFPCLKDYNVHHLGIDLTIRGLAFQEQDLGVSACATTALWCSFQKLNQFEDLGSVTPSRITMLASQHALPFGRSMPSEGLSLDQMCQAVSALGVAPNLFRAADFGYTRSLIYSAVRSGLPPILIIHDSSEEIFHAVTAVGIGVRRLHVKSPIARDFADDISGDMESLYIHDDRIGPYVRTRPKKKGESLTLAIDTDAVTWTVSHILIPMHAKIRLSFGSLRLVARNLVESVQAFRESVGGQPRPSTITIDLRIELSHQYVRHLFNAEPALDVRDIECFLEQVRMPRHLGVIQMKSDSIDPIDFILDCTSTESNTLALGALAMSNVLPETGEVRHFVADFFKCWTPSDA
jgi:hypothetical protein